MASAAAASLVSNVAAAMSLVPASNALDSGGLS